MTIPARRRLVFSVFTLFTALAYGVCWFTVTKAIDLALDTWARSWPA